MVERMTVNTQGLELAAKIRKATDDSEIQQLLNRVTTRRYRIYIRGDDPLLTPVTRLAYLAGFYQSTRDTHFFVDALEKAAVPLGKLEKELKLGPRQGEALKYSFVASQQKDRGRAVFLSDPTLERFKTPPVQQVFGQPLETLPNWKQLRENNGFKPLGSVFAQAGIRFGPQKAMTDLLKDDFPVPVVLLNRHYFYQDSREDELRDYLKKNVGRRLLMMRLRSLANGRESGALLSPIELYQYGLLPMTELIRRTISLVAYLESKKVILGRNQKVYYRLFYELFLPKAPLAILDLSNDLPLSKDRWYKYRVYPPIADSIEKDIPLIVNKIKTQTHPLRRNEERQKYQQSLLRRRDSQGSLVPLSSEEASSELQKKVKSQIGRLYQGHKSFKDDVVSVAIERLLPYLLGERGEFDNFHQLMSYALKTARNELFHQLKVQTNKDKFEQRFFDEPTLQVAHTDKFLLPSKKLVRLCQLPEHYAAILRLKSLGLSSGTIGEIMGKSAHAVRKIVYQSLNRLDPSRKKKGVSGASS